VGFELPVSGGDYASREEKGGDTNGNVGCIWCPNQRQGRTGQTIGAGIQTGRDGKEGQEERATKWPAIQVCSVYKRKTAEETFFA